MIVTVTLNPALYVDYATDELVEGATNRVGRVRYRTSGRGLAVARVLHTFGHEVVAAGLVGGSAGELIRADLARVGVATQFTRIAAESRRVVAVTDSSNGQVTAFAEPAPYVTTEELGRLASDYRTLLGDATAVVLCGSLPDGMPPEIYGSFASYAAESGVPVILDAAGSALAFGAARKPALVIPDLAQGQELADVAAPLAGADQPVVLLTSETVKVVTSEGQWQARLQAGGRVAGDAFRDALVAGFVPGIALTWSWPDMLRHAVALAAAWDPQGQLDVDAYESTLAATRLQMTER